MLGERRAPACDVIEVTAREGVVPRVKAVPHTLDAVTKAGIPVFAYGHFITVAINFAILAFIIFQMVKFMNRLKASPPPAATPEDVVLLREIRDALKAR